MENNKEILGNQPNKLDNHEDSHHRKLTEGPIIRSLITLAIPIIVANILQAAYQFTDSFWVGHLGEKAVAAVSMSGPIIFLLTSFGLGFSVAGSTLVSQYFGAKDKKMVGHAAAQTMLIVIILSLLLSLAGFILTPAILSWMGAAPDVKIDATAFLRTSFVGLAFNFCFFVFQSIMRSIGRPKLPVFIVLGTVILNFALDPLFMFGWGPIPELGVMGVALATLGTQMIAAIVGLAILFSGKRGIKLHARDFKPDFKFVKRAFMLGFPTSIEQSTRSLAMAVMVGVIAGFGTLAVAAYGVGSNIIQLTVILSLGLSLATAALVGQNIGARKIERAAKIARLGMIISFCTMTGVGIISFIIAPQLSSLFINDPGVISLSTAFIRTVALSFGLIGVQIAFSGTMQASGNPLTALAITLISQWALQLPLAIIFSRLLGLGVSGIWIIFPISNVIMTIICLTIFKRGRWKNKHLLKEELLAEKVNEDVLSERAIPYNA